MEKPVLEIKNVSTGSIQDVNLEVASGAFFVILAPSGTGKSTLLNLTCREESPASGTILINGVDVHGIADFDRWRAANIGYIYEENNLISTLTAVENVELPMVAAKVDKAKRRESALAALERMGLREKSDRFPKKLSMDEQQKVALARAVAIEPALILAYEPTGRLDQEQTKGFIELMRELNKEVGTIFVVASHDASYKGMATEILELSP